MDNLSPELNLLINLLEKKERLVAMLAPSFPVDFSYPEIIGKLKRLGFSFIVELSVGAIETNNQLLELLRKNPEKRFITNPCPSIVRLIKTKYPNLIQYITNIDSPMLATAKIVQKNYPGYTPVFIGPCISKKNEAREEDKDLNIIALTFKEIREAFNIKKIEDDCNDFQRGFDIVAKETRLYPISGGLAQSACLKDYLAEEEYSVISGIKNVLKSLEEFSINQKIRVLDILFCDGGCVGGPGIITTASLKEKRQKVINHWKIKFNLPASAPAAAKTSS